MSGVCFVDCETTGLDPDRHEIWEVGLILPDGTEYLWQLPVDLSRADPIALNVGRFHERRCRRWETPETGIPGLTEPRRFATEFVSLTHGLHLAGAVVSFDAERLWKLVRANGECPMWHYHLIDVEALAAGYLTGVARGLARVALSVPQANTLAEAGGGRVPDISQFSLNTSVAGPPWKSSDLSRAVGVDPDDFDRHTALGDARWAAAIYEAVMGT